LLLSLAVGVLGLAVTGTAHAGKSHHKHDKDSKKEQKRYEKYLREQQKYAGQPYLDPGQWPYYPNSSNGYPGQQPYPNYGYGYPGQQAYPDFGFSYPRQPPSLNDGFDQFFAWIDQAHQAEIPSPAEVALAGQTAGGTAAVPSRKPGGEREPAKAVPFLRQALALYEAASRSGRALQGRKTGCQSDPPATAAR
jgi:hypothetical protein